MIWISLRHRQESSSALRRRDLTDRQKPAGSNELDHTPIAFECRGLTMIWIILGGALPV